MFVLFFFFQAEDGIRDLVRSRGLGDVYKRQVRWKRLPGSNPMLWPLWPCSTDERPCFVLAPGQGLSLIHI